jgi:predicted PP-loop superfamily ATPase
MFLVEVNIIVKEKKKRGKRRNIEKIKKIDFRQRSLTNVKERLEKRLSEEMAEDNERLKGDLR